MNPIQTEPIIKVGILAASTIEFILKGDFLFNGETVLQDTYTATIKNNIIHCANNGRDVECNLPNAHNVSSQIELIPQHPSSTFILKNVTIGIGFHWEQQEEQEFEGGLTLQLEEGKIRAVNTVPLESYLRSVISSEMSAMNDMNLLNAHAIVSRSWLLAQIQNKKTNQKTDNTPPTASVISNADGADEIVKWYDREDHDTFDVCADDHCQRYQGITKVISLNAQKAIEATRGQVLMYNNEVCDARFSKCCGGISEDFANVWQPVKVPFLVAVRDINNNSSTNFSKVLNFGKGRINDDYFTTSPDSFCNTANPEILSQVLIDFDRTTTNFYRWTVDYSREELSSLIFRKSGIDFGDIIDMQPLERGNSGRIIRLKITGTKRTLIVGKELEIRKWLSESHLYSSAFVVRKEFEGESHLPSRFILQGAGWGHGVGMCQIGAAVMSQKGFTPVEILEHYFKGASITKIY